MIIQIRGTSGSGKSTVMRRVMQYYSWEPIYKAGRKQPLYYQRGDKVVLGHYESPCGGCDTIGSARAVYDLIQKLPHEIVLAEGLLLSEDTKWTLQMKDVRVVFLVTDLETCLERIRGRRESKGNAKPLDPRNTENRVATIERARLKLMEAGVFCRRASSGQAHKLILEWIRLHADRED